jgi:hypothetical protein
VKGTSGPLVGTLTANTHSPKVNVPMPIKLTASLKGKPAHATVIWKFLFGGQVVSTQYPCNGKACSFTGHYTRSLTFPPASLDEPLTLDVVMTASGHTVNLDWAVESHD